MALVVKMTTGVDSKMINININNNTSSTYFMVLLNQVGMLYI